MTRLTFGITELRFKKVFDKGAQAAYQSPVSGSHQSSVFGS